MSFAFGARHSPANLCVASALPETAYHRTRDSQQGSDSGYETIVLLIFDTRYIAKDPLFLWQQQQTSSSFCGIKTPILPQTEHMASRTIRNQKSKLLACIYE